MNRSVRRMWSCCVVASALACGSDDSGDDQVTFTKDIHPIFQMKCGSSECHATPNSFLPGHGAADVNAAYTEATKIWGGGQPVYEIILRKIASTNPADLMPPDYAVPPCQGGLGKPGCVTQAEYDLIKKWVDEGRPK